MDVRMLSISGSGRPFVLEVTDSSKVPSEDELKKIEDFICGGERWESREDYGDGGGGVGVRSLKLVGREDFGGLQKETEEKVGFINRRCSPLLPSPHQDPMPVTKTLRVTPSLSLFDDADLQQPSFLTPRHLEMRGL